MTKPDIIFDLIGLFSGIFVGFVAGVRLGIWSQR